MPKIRQHPSQERLKTLFRYEDGHLISIVRGKGFRYGRKVGSKATGKNSQGYINVIADKKVYKAHRLVWIYHNGDTHLDIDHIDRNRSNNKIENLREVTKSQNLHNATAKRGNKGGCVGVNWCKGSERWQASICVDYKIHPLGTSKDYFEACCLRKAGENRLSPLK